MARLIRVVSNTYSWRVRPSCFRCRSTRQGGPWTRQVGHCLLLASICGALRLSASPDLQLSLCHVNRIRDPLPRKAKSKVKNTSLTTCQKKQSQRKGPKSKKKSKTTPRQIFVAHYAGAGCAMFLIQGARQGEGEKDSATHGYQARGQRIQRCGGVTYSPDGSQSGEAGFTALISHWSACTRPLSHTHIHTHKHILTQTHTLCTQGKGVEATRSIDVVTSNICKPRRFINRSVICRKVLGADAIMSHVCSVANRFVFRSLWITCKKKKCRDALSYPPPPELAPSLKRNQSCD